MPRTLASHEGAVGTTLAVGLALVLALVLPLACGGESTDSAPEAPVDPHAAQADRPLVSAERVDVVESFRLGPAVRAASDLKTPLDLGYDEAGNLYVLDGSAPNRILKFGPDGEFQYRFGRHEPDVERIGRTNGFGIAPWNTVFLVDRAENMLVSFLTMGTFVSAIEIHGVGMGVLPMSTFGEYYLQKWDAERRRAYVVHMRTPVDSLGVPYSIAIPPGQPVRKEARDVAFRTAVDRQDRLYVGFADGYPVRIVRPDGTTVRLVGIDRPPVAKSEATIAEERERNRAGIEARLPDIADSLKAEAAEPWPLLPTIEELAIDPSGRLWVRTHRPDVAQGSVYDVFNAAGDFLAVVRVPGRVQRTAFAPDGRLVVIDATSESSPDVVGYEVRIGTGEAATAEPAAPTGDPGPEAGTGSASAPGERAPTGAP